MVNQLPDVDLCHYISVNNHQLVTPSTRIAEVFSKQHRNVLRAIRNLECSGYFNALNFERVSYKDAKGELREMYNVTKDGFIFLVMGFTGQQAAAIKEAYINAFNIMAERLAAHPAPKIADVAVSQARYIELLEAENALLKRGHHKRPKKPAAKRITPAEKDTIRQLASMGLSLRDIALRTGRSTASISFLVRDIKEGSA